MVVQRWWCRAGGAEGWFRLIVQRWCRHGEEVAQRSDCAEVVQRSAEVVQTDCTEVAQRCRWRCRCSWTEGVDVNAGVGSDTVKGSRNSGILEY